MSSAPWTEAGGGREEIMEREEGKRNEADRPISTSERILAAAVEVIEREGAERATVRMIAAEAGVNLAAINYHFRSKDELMEAAIRSTWEHASRDLRAFLQVESSSLSERIEALLLYLLQGGRVYPNITRAFLFGAGNGPYPAILEGQRAFAVELAAMVGRALDVPADEALVVRTSALYFFCLYSALAPGSLPSVVEAGEFNACARLLAADYLAAAAGRGKIE